MTRHRREHGPFVFEADRPRPRSPRHLPRAPAGSARADPAPTVSVVGRSHLPTPLTPTKIPNRGLPSPRNRWIFCSRRNRRLASVRATPLGGLRRSPELFSVVIGRLRRWPDELYTGDRGLRRSPPRFPGGSKADEGAARALRVAATGYEGHQARAARGCRATKVPTPARREGRGLRR